jgi:hypothetical protein
MTISLDNKKLPELSFGSLWIWLRGQALHLRPSGYEPDELPGCSTPRYKVFAWGKRPVRKTEGFVAVA